MVGNRGAGESLKGVEEEEEVELHAGHAWYKVPGGGPNGEVRKAVVIDTQLKKDD